ncbi:MAG TPA: chemotaxis protein CheW [Dongiaceae bacterium]|nr:chemotaxis protein CheW [Dongiaceae bacterium]
MAIDVDKVLVFQSGPIRFGVAVDLVQAVIPACEISPLPSAPAAVEGVFMMDGEVVPVVDPLRAFYADRATRLDLGTRFLLVNTGRRKLALSAERVDGVTQHARGNAEATRQLVPNATKLREIATAPDGLIYITAPDALLSDSDEVRLSGAIVAFAQGQAPSGPTHGR